MIVRPELHSIQFVLNVLNNGGLIKADGFSTISKADVDCFEMKHSDFDYTQDGIIEVLEANGFKHEEIEEVDNDYYVKPARKE